MTLALQIKFDKYHTQNPHIYEAFERYALVATTYRKHFGAKSIMERLRWETMVIGGDEYKINNNYAAYYARLFEAVHPAHIGFFRKRGV